MCALIIEKLVATVELRSRVYEKNHVNRQCHILLYRVPQRLTKWYLDGND